MPTEAKVSIITVFCRHLLVYYYIMTEQREHGTVYRHYKILWCIWGRKKGKAIPVTGRGGPRDCETSRLPHFPTIGSQMAVRVSALCAGLPLPPGRFLILISVRGWVDPRIIVRLEGLRKLKKSNDLIGNQTRDLPTCSIVPQPTRWEMQCI
jgi:hypothetical protein